MLDRSSKAMQASSIVYAKESLLGRKIWQDVYLYFLHKKNEEYMPEHTLVALAKYSKNKSITKKVCLALKKHAFDKRTNSILVNEIIGLFYLFSGCYRYAKLTLKMRKLMNER